MTWKELLVHLKAMEKIGHTSMEQTVFFISGDDVIPLDVFESLRTGDVYFMTNIVNSESNDE
jgi:hypothetical protein